MIRKTAVDDENDESLLDAPDLHRHNIFNMSNRGVFCSVLCLILTISSYSFALFAIGYYTGYHDDRELDGGSDMM
jgi:hypothetical protein